MKFGNTESDLSQRSGDWDAGRAKRREQAANGSHHRGEYEAADHQGRRDSKLERDFGEAREIRRSRGEPMDRQRQNTTDDAADERQRDRFGEKRRHDAKL